MYIRSLTDLAWNSIAPHRQEFCYRAESRTRTLEVRIPFYLHPNEANPLSTDRDHAIWIDVVRCATIV